MFSLRKIFGKSHIRQESGTFLLKLEQILGFAPRNLNLYREAFTHPSYSTGSGDSYERLEFLGDSVLGAVISHYLFQTAPDRDEGYLTKMRSKMVQREYLNQLGKELKLDQLLYTRTAEEHLGANINGNLFESLVGAVYLDRGYEDCMKFIKRKLIKPLDDVKKLENKVISYKSLLLEWTQKNKKSLHFETEEDETDKNNEKYFVSKLYIEGVLESKARETSKKKAEEKAAKRAFYRIENHFNN